MTNDIEIKEIVPVDLEGGTLVNGFPSSGITSAIATESLINTSNFELQANIDSDKFPPISIIKNGMPNYATRIFVNRGSKGGNIFFISYTRCKNAQNGCKNDVRLGKRKKMFNYR